MQNYNRTVIDLYKQYFTAYKNGDSLSDELLTEAQSKLGFAIDRAKIDSEPTDELEALKNDINYLKYELI